MRISTPCRLVLAAAASSYYATAFQPLSLLRAHHQHQYTSSSSTTTSLDASKCGNYDFDVAIVGCGVGGHGAALHARAQQLETAVFAGGDVGGSKSKILLLL